MKRIVTLLMVLFMLLTFTIPILAADGATNDLEATSGSEATSSIEPSQPVSTALDGLDLSTVQKYWDSVNAEMNKYIPTLNLKDMVVSLAKGEFKTGITEIFMGLVRYLFKEMVTNSRLMGQILILSVFCVLLQNVQSAFEKGTVGKLAWTACYMTVLTLALKSFTIAVQTGRDTVEDMVSFMQAMLPVLLTILTSMGNVTSTALLHPLTLTVLSLVSMLIKNIVFPLIFLSTLLSLANQLTSKVEVSKLAGLFKQWSMALLGIFFTGFLGFMAVQGIAGSVADGVALRTAKFGLGAFVPVIGKMVSDTLETVIGTSVLLKNAVGLVGILAVFFMCAFPVLKILSLILIYKVTGALVEPIGDKILSASLNTMGNSLTLVFVSVLTVAVMFFFVIAIIIGTGDYSLMLR